MGWTVRAPETELLLDWLSAELALQLGYEWPYLSFAPEDLDRCRFGVLQVVIAPKPGAGERRGERLIPLITYISDQCRPNNAILRSLQRSGTRKCRIARIARTERCNYCSMVGVAGVVFGLVESPMAISVVLCSTLAIYFLYRLFFAPLSKVPGPWITALTSLYVIYHEFKGDRTVVIDRLHAKYGPVVRVSPTEVSFNSPDALREIYGIKSSYSKSRFYDMFVYYNERNTFTSLDRPQVSVCMGVCFLGLCERRPAHAFPR